MSRDSAGDPAANQAANQIAQTPTPLWRIYLTLGRVSNLPTVWSNCLAGVILAGGVPNAFPMLALVLSAKSLRVCFGRPSPRR